MKKLLIPLELILFIILFGVTIVLFTREEDEGPTICFNSGEIIYTEDSDTELLLEGVTAIDAIDGDVSSTLMIESIVPLGDNEKAKVCYAAKDKDNNITKDNLIVNYITTLETMKIPSLQLTSKEVRYIKGSKIDPFDFVVSISDDIDKETTLENRITVEGFYDMNKIGTYILEFYVKDLDQNQSLSQYLKIYVVEE